MTGVFDDILPSLSKIGEEINNLPSQLLHLEDTISKIAEIIFSNSNLYYVYTKIVQGEKLVVNSVFCRDKDELERFERSYPKEMQIYWDQPMGVDNWVLVNGTPSVDTFEKKHNTFFDSPIFRDAFSHASLPLKLLSKSVGTLSLGSADIIKEYLPEKRDERIAQLHTDTIDFLISIIAQTLAAVNNQNYE